MSLLQSKSKNFLALFLTLFTVSCTTSGYQAMSRLYPGMSQYQVVSKIGNPDFITTDRGYEVFGYRMYDNFDTWEKSNYLVYFNNGRTVAFGTPGQFEVAALKDTVRVQQAAPVSYPAPYPSAQIYPNVQNAPVQDPNNGAHVRCWSIYDGAGGYKRECTK